MLPLLPSTGDPIGLLLPVLQVAGFAIAAALLVAYHLARDGTARACFLVALALVFLLHWASLSTTQYWIWKGMMVPSSEEPYTIVVPITTVALVLSPLLRRRWRGDAAGLDFARLEPSTLALRWLLPAVGAGVLGGVLLSASDRWSPETHLRFSEAHSVLWMLLWVLVLAVPGAVYSLGNRERHTPHRVFGGWTAGCLAQLALAMRAAPHWGEFVRAQMAAPDEIVVRTLFASLVAGVYSGAAAWGATALTVRRAEAGAAPSRSNPWRRLVLRWSALGVIGFLLFPSWFLEDTGSERWVFGRWRQDYGHALFFLPPPIRPDYARHSWSMVEADWVLVAENVGTLLLVALALAAIPAGREAKPHALDTLLRHARRVALTVPLLLPTPAKGVLTLPLALEMSRGMEPPLGVVFALFGAGAIYVAYAGAVYGLLLVARRSSGRDGAL